jgi:hypothetical protein
LKFNAKDRFVLGGIPGTIVTTYPATIFRDGTYRVTFDEHTGGEAESSYNRENSFSMAWFDARAEFEPKPTNPDLLANFKFGQKFRVAASKNADLWGTLTFIKIVSHDVLNLTHGETMVQAHRADLDVIGDFCIFESDIITKED